MISRNDLLSIINFNVGYDQDVLIISTPHDLPYFKKLLGNGSDYGIKLSYKEQIVT